MTTFNMTVTIDPAPSNKGSVSNVELTFRIKAESLIEAVSQAKAYVAAVVPHEHTSLDGARKSLFT